MHNTSPFRSVVSMTTVSAFISSAVRREKKLVEFTVALCDMDTHKATQLSSPTEVGNNTFIQSTIFISNLLRAEKETFLSPETWEFCKAVTKLDAECWGFVFLNLETSNGNNWN